MWRVLAYPRGEAAPMSLVLAACRQLQQAYHGSALCSDQGSMQAPGQPSTSDVAPTRDQPAQTSRPTASPLQSLRQRLVELSDQTPASTSLQDTGHQPLPAGRTWKWYHPSDEREWQMMELKKQYPGAGLAHVRNVPTGVKKMDRILRLVRGLHYEEAVRQMRALPHKAARYTEEALEHALEDAMEKQLDQSKLVVDTVYATKGQYFFERGYKAKGKGTKITHKRCHVLVQLRELTIPYQGFKTHALPPVTLTLPSRQFKPQHKPLFITNGGPFKRVPSSRQL